MKVSEVDKSVRFVDFENTFDVYEDKRGMYVYNLNSNVYLNGVPTAKFSPSHDMFWTTISYELYKTTRLWWILMKLNQVKMEDTFKPVRAGETIYYLEEPDMQSLLNSIMNLSE